MTEESELGQSEGKIIRAAKLHEFAEALSCQRAGKTVVCTSGCYDIVHAAHVESLRRAKALGDILVVAIGSDEQIRRRKGPERPAFGVEERARVLAAMEAVDYVVVFDEPIPFEFLRILRPEVYAKGRDYEGVDVPEAALMKELGGRFELVGYDSPTKQQGY